MKREKEQFKKNENIGLKVLHNFLTKGTCTSVCLKKKCPLYQPTKHLMCLLGERLQHRGEKKHLQVAKELLIEMFFE